ncbi:hypothetical protein [Parasitella parasitica]|uniref:Myb-like domain-containing protein n=1 Tax=Parasitella parasitica TaxID=35722 RepID=A0A0B7N7V7_9FUNG|nr:hypothetical protein [Parasitella parasitica]
MPLKRISEKDCWFIIGAHQAGATERQCSELSGLSKTVTHNIITNFKKLGSPHASSLSVNALINSPDQKRKFKDKEELKDVPRKRGRPRKPIEAPFFTRSIVRNVLKQAGTGQSMNGVQDSPAMYPLDRLNTPPTDEDSQHWEVPSGREIKKMRRESIKEEMLPCTPGSIIALDDSDDEESDNSAWTMEEDKELLEHVLGLPVKNVKWKAVEAQFDDRHLAKMCSERWDYLKKQLIKDIHHILIEEQDGNTSNT